MKPYELCESLGLLDEELLLKTDALRKKKRPVLIYALSSVAACICIVFAVINIIAGIPKSEHEISNDNTSQTPSDTDHFKDDPADEENKSSSDDADENKGSASAKPNIQVKVERITDYGFEGSLCDNLQSAIFEAGSSVEVILSGSDYNIKENDIVTIIYYQIKDRKIYAKGVVDIERKE